MLQQITPKIQPFLQQVKAIYQHPLHYTYILHKTDGFLHLYDQATMDILGKTKVVVLDQMKLFAFMMDFNVFYGLRENRFLRFQLSSSQWVSHIPIESDQQSKPYLESYYLCFYPQMQILICVTRKNFYLVSHNGGAAFKTVPQLRDGQELIFPEKVAEISGLQWVIGYKNTLYLLKFSQNFDSYQICDKLIVGNIIRLSSQQNPKKSFVYVINDQNELYLIKVNQQRNKLQIAYKFYNPDYIPMYLTLLRLGINTSTTDKFRNRLYINVYAKQNNQKIFQEGEMMLEQDQQNRQKYALFIVPTEVHQVTQTDSQSPQQTVNLQISQQTFLIRDMPKVKISPWINIFTQNCLLFLTTNNQVCYIDFCSIKQLQLKADQWICMGYKFEELQRNQVYEQREDQYEDPSEKQERQLTKEFLDDWSQSNLPKNVVLTKAYNRIRSLDL